MGYFGLGDDDYGDAADYAAAERRRLAELERDRAALAAALPEGWRFQARESGHDAVVTPPGRALRVGDIWRGPEGAAFRVENDPSSRPVWVRTPWADPAGLAAAITAADANIAAEAAANERAARWAACPGRGALPPWAGALHSERSAEWSAGNAAAYAAFLAAGTPADFGAEAALAAFDGAVAAMRAEAARVAAALIADGEKELARGAAVPPLPRGRILVVRCAKGRDGRVVGSATRSNQGRAPGRVVLFDGRQPGAGEEWIVQPLRDAGGATIARLVRRANEGRTWSIRHIDGAPCLVATDDLDEVVHRPGENAYAPKPVEAAWAARVEAWRAATEAALVAAGAFQHADPHGASRAWWGVAADGAVTVQRQIGCFTIATRVAYTPREDGTHPLSVARALNAGEEPEIIATRDGWIAACGINGSLRIPVREAEVPAAALDALQPMRGWAMGYDGEPQMDGGDARKLDRVRDAAPRLWTALTAGSQFCAADGPAQRRAEELNVHAQTLRSILAALPAWASGEAVLDLRAYTVREAYLARDEEGSEWIEPVYGREVVAPGGLSSLVFRSPDPDRAPALIVAGGTRAAIDAALSCAGAPVVPRSVPACFPPAWLGADMRADTRAALDAARAEVVALAAQLDTALGDGAAVIAGLSVTPEERARRVVEAERAARDAEERARREAEKAEADRQWSLAREARWKREDEERAAREAERARQDLAALDPRFARGMAKRQTAEAAPPVPPPPPAPGVKASADALAGLAAMFGGGGKKKK